MNKNSLKVICLILCMLLLTSTVSFAATPQEVSTDDFLTAINTELAENQTSVEEELNNSIAEYEQLRSVCSDTVQKAKFTELIETLIELRDEYLLENSGAACYSVHPIYATEAASVIAYFKLHDYRLSAELLTHMKANKVLDSKYDPFYGGDICETALFKQIHSDSTTSGSAAFLNSGSKFDKDAYYAIHRFDYVKTSIYTMIITDRYDYESDKEYTSIAGVAISKMYKAQQDGYLTPFYIKVYCSSAA